LQCRPLFGDGIHGRNRAFLAATLAFDEWGHLSIVSHIDV
jgi:hypothetical protein